MSDKNKNTALRYQAILDTVIDGVVTIDHRGIVETINPAAARLFGYDKEEVIGNNINMLMPEPYHSAHNAHLSRYQSTKEAHIIGHGREVTGKKKDGTIFPIRLAVSEVVLQDKVIFTGIIHDLTDVKAAQQKNVELYKNLEKKVSERTYELENVVNQLLTSNNSLKREVTERKLAEQKLKDSEEALRVSLVKEKELNELKSRFVSMASHEFRTPLTSIMSSAALIGKYPKAEHQKNREKHIARIKSSVSNLTGILNDFLSLGKLEEGKTEINLTELNLDLLCMEVIDDTKNLLKSTQSVKHTIHGTNTEVIVDERILRNILTNLISNAIKYSSEEITCDFYFYDDYFQFRIKDTGIGIPDDDQKHLFTRFFRARNAANIQGTGLGLNIVKRYVDLLKGDISYKSKLDMGTTFYVNIPH